MAVIKDGAARKHDAAMVDANLRKQQLQVKTKDLTKKIEAGRIMKNFLQSDGWKMILAHEEQSCGWNQVMGAFRKKEGLDEVMYKRQALEAIVNYANQVVKWGEEASEELSRLEE